MKNGVIKNNLYRDSTLWLRNVTGRMALSVSEQYVQIVIENMLLSVKSTVLICMQINDDT